VGDARMHGFKPKKKTREMKVERGSEAAYRGSAGRGGGGGGSPAAGGFGGDSGERGCGSGVVCGKGRTLERRTDEKRRNELSMASGPGSRGLAAGESEPGKGFEICSREKSARVVGPRGWSCWKDRRSRRSRGCSCSVMRATDVTSVFACPSLAQFSTRF